MSRYRHYLFDLYGTLADIRTDEQSRRLWERTALWYAEHGAPYRGSELRSAYLRLCAAEQARSDDPLHEIELRRVFRALYTEKGLRAGLRLVEDTAVFFRIASLKKLRRYPWVEPVFRQLRAAGAGIYLLSNAQACFTRPELRALGLEHAFDGVVLSSDAGVKKPSPAILRLLLERYALDPADCLMVGNEQAADVGVARTAGLDALYLRTETSPPYDPSLRAEYELLDGDFTKIPTLLGL